jgi:hypothetical protein
MSRDDYEAARRLPFDVVVFPDPDEPHDWGFPIGLNAERVLDALKKGGFVLFRTDRGSRRAAHDATR